jgi:hypothetical protein
MTLPWLPYVVGVFLGLLPPKLFYSTTHWRHATLVDATTTGHLSASGRHRTSSGSLKWWTLPLLWLDPIRGFLAAHFVATGLYRLPTDTAEQLILIVALTALTSFVILTVQMEFGHQRSKDLLAPVAFLFGYVTGIYPGSELMGGSVAVIGVLALVGSRNLTMGYLAAGVVACIFGYKTLGLGMSLGVFAATAAAPVPYAFLRRARLVVPVRR